MPLETQKPSVDIASGQAAVTVADGADVTQGARADAAITTDASGSQAGKLRGIVKMLASAWDSVNNRFRVGIHDDGNSISVDDGGGVLSTDSADGAHATLGATSDADTANTVIGRLKKIVSLLAGGLPAALSGSGNLKVAIVENTAGGAGGTVLHSTTANLANGAAFTGSWVSVLNYAQVTVNVFASHDSAAGGLVVEWSDDGSTTRRTEKAVSVLASVPLSLAYRPKGEYFRVVYTNGGTTQTTFSLETIGHPNVTRDELKTITLRVTPSITTSPAYSDRDCVGGKLTFSDIAPVGGASFIINKVALADKDNERARFVVLFFRDNPNAGGTTLTDNSPLDLDDTDLFKIAARVRIEPADYDEFADNAYGVVGGVNQAITLDGNDLYVALMIRQGKTYTSTSDLQLEITLTPAEN